MKFRLAITDEASRQLLACAMYYAEASQSFELAVNWYDGFITDLESLAQNPHRCAIAPESEQFDFELREMLYGSGRRRTHRAIFRVRGNIIEVLTIRHHAQRPLQPGDLPPAPS